MRYCARKDGLKYDQAVYDRFKELWNAGMVVTEIAAKMNEEFKLTLSRNSVCGFAYRARLNGIDLIPRNNPISRRSPLPKGSHKMYDRKPVDVRNFSSTCMFYAGDPRTSVPCGEPVMKPGHPYCTKHHHVCYNREDK